MKGLNLVLPQKSNKVYGLVDCDSFFASCEVFRNPKLIGKPVCIGREHDIILASTYEAKAKGVKTGTPHWEAARLLRNGIFIEPDFDFYRKMSNKVMSYLSTISNSIEIFSIDEAFIDLTGLNEIYNLSYPILIHKLKLAIKKNVGIPVSIGSSSTKLLAKMFTHLAKPFGTFFEKEENNIDQILGKMHLREIPFIGKGRGERLKYNCKTALDFKKLDYEYINKIMGKHGIKLWFELNGIDNLKFSKNNMPKSISRTHSFHPDFTSDKDTLWKYFIENFEKAFATLIEEKVATKEMIIFLRRKDFNYEKGEYIFPFPSLQKDILIQKAKNIFEEIYIPQLYRGTGIAFTSLYSTEYLEEDMFVYVKQYKEQKLYNVINNINSKYGSNTLTTAENVNTKKIIRNLNFIGDIS